MNHIELKLLRISLGFSENQAASLIGKMSQSSWHKLEKGVEGCVIHQDIIHTMKNAEEFLKSEILHVFNEQDSDADVEYFVFTNEEAKIENLNKVGIFKLYDISVDVALVVVDRITELAAIILGIENCVIINSIEELNNYYERLNG